MENGKQKMDDREQRAESRSWIKAGTFLNAKGIPPVQKGVSPHLIILSHMFPNNIDINSGIFIYEQVKNLALLNKYKITVISPVPYSPRILWFRKKWRDYGKILRKGNMEGIEILYPRYLSPPGRHLFFLRGITMFFSLLPVIKKIIRKNEEAVIHSHTVLPDGLAALLLKKVFKGIKTVCSARGSDINIYPYRNRAAMYLTRYSLKNNDAITTVSLDLKNKCMKLCEEAVNRIGVVYNGLGKEWFEITEEEQREIEDLKSEYNSKYNIETKLLFVGELSKEKGIYELISSFSHIIKEYKEIGLFIIGDGVEKENLKSECIKNHIEDKVIFAGKVKHEKVKVYMNFCDILILPSYSEGMPNVMLEAMACSRPVIVTKVGGVAEVIVDKYNGMLIEAKSIKSITEAVKSLINDKGLYESISRNAYDLVKDNFSWQKNAHLMDSIYEDILRG